MTDVERLELFVIARALRPRLNALDEAHVSLALSHAADAMRVFICNTSGAHGKKLPKVHPLRKFLAIVSKKPKRCEALIDLANQACDLLLAEIGIHPDERVTAQEWYIRARSKRRRIRSRTRDKCSYCEESPVTPGTRGKFNKPYSSCKPCRRKNSAKQRRLRAAWRGVHVLG